VGLSAGPRLPRSGRGRLHANSCNSFRLPINAQGSSRGGTGTGEGKLPRLKTLLASPFSPLLPFAAQPGYLAGPARAEAREQLEGGGWEQSTTGKGPSARGRRDLALPPYGSPLNSQHREHLKFNDSTWRYTESRVQRDRQVRDGQGQ
jgi:hypothetical protein